MRFSVWPNLSQSWTDILATAKHAEETGWDGVWAADHFMPNGPDVGGATHECWSTIAALAALVPRVRIGSLVSGNTYRHPAVLAKAATTIDVISGGRLVLGLGAGWQENEHAAYGIDFFTTGTRLRRLEEACRVIKSLTTTDRSDFAGRHYSLKAAPLEPKPVQRPLPLLVGGGGEKVTLRIAATFADEWNVWGTPEVLRHKMSVLDEHCSAIGRDPKEIKRSAQALLFMSDDASFLDRVRGQASDRALIGTPSEVAATVADYIDAGVDELIVPDFTLGPMDRKIRLLDQFMEQVVSRFR